MKKFLLFCVFLTTAFITKAQELTRTSAMQLVAKNRTAIGLSEDQLNNLKLSSTYYNELQGTQMIYLLQTYKGLPVYNKMLVLAFKNDTVVSNAGKLIQDIEKITFIQAAAPSVMARDAVKTAFTTTRLTIPASLPIINSTDNGSKIDFGKSNAVSENVKAELMWIPIEKGNQISVKLAWQVQVVPAGKSDWWNIQIDAATGAVIDKINLTVYEARNQKEYNDFSLLRPGENNLQSSQTNKLNFFSPDFFAPPPTVTSASYRVIPFPLESPNFGSIAVVNNPWALSGAGNNATTHGWHFDGTTNYDITRGNNVFAYLDVSSSNAPEATSNWPDTSTTPIPSLTFTQTPVFTQQPSEIVNKKFAVTNLFYWSNLMHDVFYQYGFNEAAGNYQTDNIGRGGIGDDYVRAEAQDGSGTNNANFTLSADGVRGKMQMFIFDPVPGTTNLRVNAPAVIAGNYIAVESAFSATNKLANVGPVTATLEYFNDASGGTHDACTGAPSNTLTGKIALIKRGGCNFTVKVLAAQAAGAVAVIMINNVAGDPGIMGGGPDNTIIIPAVMITDIDGANIAAQLGAGVNVTLSGTAGGTINLDGDLDNGVVCHEYGHGISSRLTGGPSTVTCLQNAEQGGEGWSDYIALMMTTNWATAAISNGTLLRRVGTYVNGETGTGEGIRNYPYTTNMSTNPLTYAHMGLGAVAPWKFSTGTEVHNIGEIWGAALWDMTWGIIQQQGSINTNLFNAGSSGGNSVALKLVVEGMKLQPCSPGFLDSRDAIITADKNLYGSTHLCTIWAAFAKRGMGYSAVQGSSFSATDQTAAFDLPPTPAFTVQPTNVSVCLGSNGTISVTATGYNLTYIWQVSTDGGVTWNNIIPAATTATLTLNSVTAGMNNNRYRTIITGGCANTSVTSAAVLLTVTNPTTISSQPANSTLCSGGNTSFSVTAAGVSLTYQWQVSIDAGATWNNVASATLSALTLNAVTGTMNNNQYRVLISSCTPGGLTSAAATLTVNAVAGITSQPANTTVCAGSNASFTTVAVGNAISYQWQLSIDGGTSFNNIIGANAATLNLPAVTAGMNNNLYRVSVSNACPSGAISTAALLTVTNPSIISLQPVNTTVCSGSNASFSITATGSSLTYQWQVSTDAGANWNNIVGATSTLLTLPAVTTAMNNNQYRVIVSSCVPGGLISSAAILTVNAGVNITTQPASVSVCTGSNTNFTVTATGTALSYQWQLSTNGGTSYGNIAGANTVTLSLNAVTLLMNNNRYRVIVTNTCPSSITSSAAILTVGNSTVISAQPANATVCAGVNTTFSISATGSNITYQWQASLDAGGTWANITGATASSFLLNSVSTALNNNRYRVILSNCALGSLISNAATLIVNAPVSINTQPASTVECTGNNVTFTTAATGTNISYQWQISSDAGASWANISGAISNSLTLNAVTAGLNGNQYRVVVSGSCNPGGINSSAALLTINNSVNISQQPASTAVCAGTDVNFTTNATGSGLTYQWQVSTNAGASFANISGAVTNTLLLTAVIPAMNNNQYRVLLNGNCVSNLFTSAATLTVNSSVSIVTQPVSQVGCAPNAAIFSVVATGTTITYQWQISTNTAASWSDIAGAVNSSLTIASLTPLLTGNQYRVIVSGAPCGVLTSNAATLTVAQLPVVTISANPSTAIYPTRTTTLSASVTPSGIYTYQWFKNDVAVAGVTAGSLLITIDDLGRYKVIANNSNGCSNVSNNISITDSLSNTLFIYPNPTGGKFQVRYYSNAANNPARIINVFDSKGAKVYSKSYTVLLPYDRMEVNLGNATGGIYYVELLDESGKKIGTGTIFKY